MTSTPSSPKLAEPLKVVAVISERSLQRLASGNAHCVHAYAKVVDEDDNSLVRLSDAQASIQALEADASRYRWLREQNWFSGPLCVLSDPKRVLTRGIGLGAECPFGSRLDAAIDAARAAQEVKP